MAQDLKPPIHGYAIWLMASGSAHEKLQQLIDGLSHFAGSHRFDAHATLIGLLDYTSAQKEQLVQGADELARSSSPLEVELIGVGMRQMYFQSVIAPVAPMPQLVALNQAARQLFKHEADPPFMPHVSMIYGDFGWQLKHEALQKITAQIQFPFQVTFDRLALVRADGYPDEWTIEHEAQMK